jgi:hypothetical protein
LFAYNWPARSERYRLLESFVQAFFSRFSEFLGDAHHPRWRELNLLEPLPGWKRFVPAERWLQRQTANGKLDRFPAANPTANPPDDGALFEEFLRWRQQNRKDGNK